MPANAFAKSRIPLMTKLVNATAALFSGLLTSGARVWGA